MNKPIVMNPIVSFSATRRMRTFRTMLIVIAYEAALLLIALVMLSPFLQDRIAIGSLRLSPLCFMILTGAQFGLLILIAPAMTSGSIAGERERRTLDLLLVTNTGSFRIAVGKALESFALLAVLILCGLPVMCLCLLTGGVTAGQILLAELFLLAEAFACVSVGVFCSSMMRSTVISAVISYLVILLIGTVTLLPFLTGYPQRITDVLYDRQQYAGLTATGARAMISPLLYLNPAFGLFALLQGQTRILTRTMSTRGWGRILATWMMADRAGWDFITLASAGSMLILSAVLLALAALRIRRSGRAVRRRKA